MTIEINKILIIALSGAGDILMATPLIRELKLNLPNVQIDCLVMQGQIAEEILQNNNDISKIIYFNFMKEGNYKSFLFCNKLRKENYDLSISTYPQARYHYSFVSWLIGTKRRIGFNYQTQKLKLNKLFFTDTIDENFEEHVVINNLKVLNILNLKQKIRNPKLILNISKESEKFADNYFKKNNIKRAIILHAGAGKTKNFQMKRWPVENFIGLAKELSKRGYRIILAGGSDEDDLKNHIIKESKLTNNRQIFNLNADINKVAAVIKKSDLVIANDAVIGHIASAVGTKVISLFGPTSPENTAPFTKNKIVISKRPNNIKPYMHGSKGIIQAQANTMKLITINDVLSKIKGI